MTSPSRYLCFLIAALAVGLLPGCSTHTNGLSGKALRQQHDADKLADDYLHCIDTLIKRTAREKYVDNNTRKNVVMDSCQDTLTPFTIVQEEAINNACVAAGNNSQACDGEAVRKTERKTMHLKQKAIARIDASPLEFYDR